MESIFDFIKFVGDENESLLFRLFIFVIVCMAVFMTMVFVSTVIIGSKGWVIIPIVLLYGIFTIFRKFGNWLNKK